MPVFCFLHISASLAFMESLVLLFSLLCSRGDLTNKNVMALKLLCIFHLLSVYLNNKLRSPPIF